MKFVTNTWSEAILQEWKLISSIDIGIILRVANMCQPTWFTCNSTLLRVHIILLTAHIYIYTKSDYVYSNSKYYITRDINFHECIYTFLKGRFQWWIGRVFPAIHIYTYNGIQLMCGVLYLHKCKIPNTKP